MDDAAALKIMSALGQATRLKIMRSLVDASPTGLQSGDLAEIVGVPRALMSSHLAILSKAGIVTSIKVGRSVSYLPNAPVLCELSDFLRAWGVDPKRPSLPA